MLGIYFYLFNKELNNKCMDDFLYFLLLIGWLGYSFYRQSEKKKKLLAKKREVESPPLNTPAQYPGPSGNYQETPVNTEPDFAKTLEEILLGKNEIESLEEIPESEAQSLETIPEPGNHYSDLNQRAPAIQTLWYNETASVINRSGREEELKEPEIMLFEEDSVFAREDSNHFNLRLAVVYSEILNRKYS